MSGRLRSYARINARSQKVKDGAHDFRAVYAEVDARSEGRCEAQFAWGDLPDGGSYSLVAPLWGREVLQRCMRRAVDHHHLVKPRRAAGSHTPSLIVHLCRSHHERTEYPFKRGRLVILPAAGVGEFTYRIQFAASKFQARGQGE